MSDAKRRWLGVLRVALYAALVAVVGGLLMVRKVVANASELSLRLGDELGAWSELIGASTAITVNGQQLFLGSKTVSMPVSAVLERFGALCRAEDAEPLAALGAGAGVSTDPSQAPPGWLDRLLVLQRARGKQGAAACLAGAGRGGLAALQRRVQRFARTRDLSEIGALRYVRATDSGRGTHVIAVWNRGPLALDAWLPEHGDAPGDDFPAGARPAQAVRMLSAEVPDSAQRVNLYRSAQGSAAALDDYAGQLRARGFAHVATPLPDGREPGHGRMYVKDGRALLVRTQAGADGTMLSVLELDALAAGAGGAR